MALADLLDPDASILIVDDVPSARLTLKSFLKRLGYRTIVEAKDGDDAWERLQENPSIRLIVCDWEMPNMSGVQLAERLSDDPRFMRIPLVLATSKTGSVALTEAALKGAAGYIAKPFTVESLAEELEGAIQEFFEALS